MLGARTSRWHRLVPWALALGAVLLIGVFASVDGRAYLATQAAIRDTLASRETMTETLSLLKDAETGARGFLLTGDESFLQPYDDARQRVDGVLGILARLGDDDPAQGAAALHVASLAHQKLDVLASMLAKRRASAVTPSDLVPSLDQGKRIMDALRVEISLMLTRADGDLEEHEAATAHATRRVEGLLAVALIGGVLLTIAGFNEARRDAARARQTSEQLARDIAAKEKAEAALLQQTGLLESVLESMGDGVVVVNREREHTIVNTAARRFLPWSVGQAAPSEWSEPSNTFLPDGKTVFPAQRGPLTRALRGEPVDGVDLVVRTPSDELRSYSVTARPVVSGSETIAAVAVFRDTTTLQQAEKDLQDSEHRYRVLADASFEGLAITNAGNVVDTNANLARWLGYEGSTLVGMPSIALFAPEDRERLLSLTTNPDAAYEASMLRHDGTTFPVEVRGQTVTYQGEPARIATIRDVTEKKAREAELVEKSEQLRALSLRDELTGLHNRRGFLELAEHQMKTAVRSQQSCAVFFADLNGMKQINDQLGHEMGDHAIRATAQVLLEVFRSSDVVSRLGGDEFAVFATDCDEQGVTAACARLEKAADALNAQGNHPYRLSISAGAAVRAPTSELDLAALVQAADLKMYEVKRARRAPPPLRLISG